MQRRTIRQLYRYQDCCEVGIQAELDPLVGVHKKAALGQDISVEMLVRARRDDFAMGQLHKLVELMTAESTETVHRSLGCEREVYLNALLAALKYRARQDFG